MNVENAALWQFPQYFPIKIMGRRHDDLADSVAQIVLKHAPDFDVKSMEMRSSKNGHYLSLTCTICAQNKAQLDALYNELCAHPLIAVVL